MTPWFSGFDLGQLFQFLFVAHASELCVAFFFSL